MAKKKSQPKAATTQTQTQQQEEQKVRMHHDHAEPLIKPRPKNAAADPPPRMVTPTPIPTMTVKKASEESMEMLQNLKSLNAVLVKQAHELRVERSSLMSVNGILELENGRLELEKEEKEDEVVRTNLEKDVMAAVVKKQAQDMKSLMTVKEAAALRVEMVEKEMEVLRSDKVSAVRALKELGEYSLDVEKERNALKVEAVAMAEEAAALRASVGEILEREGEIVEALQQLKKDNEAALRAKMERDAEIEVLAEEKELLNLSLLESISTCKSLKVDIDHLSKEKDLIEIEKNEKLFITNEQEKQVMSLRESVFVLQSEVKRLREVVSELEKCNVELSGQRDDLSMEFNVLKSLNSENEMRISALLDEKAILAKRLDESASDMEKTMRGSEKEKAVLEAEIVDLREAHKAELAEMKELACQLKNQLELTLQSCMTEKEEKKTLISELEHLRIEMETVIAEKLHAERDVQLEKKNVECLTQNIVQLETRIHESAKDIKHLEIKISKLIETKEALESQVELLMEEKDAVHKSLEKAEQNINKVNAESEYANGVSDAVLHMLKKTRAQLYESGGDMVDRNAELPEMQNDDRVKPFVSELEAIKSAYASRESVMEDMRKQLEVMKQSVAEAHKRKSLWKLISSATTLFAAASVAYASRGH